MAKKPGKKTHFDKDKRATPEQVERAIASLGEFPGKAEYSRLLREKGLGKGGLARLNEFKSKRLVAQTYLRKRLADSLDMLSWLQGKPLLDLKARDDHTKQGLVSYMPEEARPSLLALAQGKTLEECGPGLKALESISSSVTEHSRDTRRTARFILEKVALSQKEAGVPEKNEKVRLEAISIIEGIGLSRSLPVLDWLAFSGKAPKTIQKRAQEVSFKLWKNRRAKE